MDGSSVKFRQSQHDQMYYVYELVCCEIRLHTWQIKLLYDYIYRHNCQYCLMAWEFIRCFISLTVLFRLVQSVDVNNLLSFARLPVVFFFLNWLHIQADINPFIVTVGPILWSFFHFVYSFLKQNPMMMAEFHFSFCYCWTETEIRKHLQTPLLVRAVFGKTLHLL